MEHENIILMMMDALDGELAEEERLSLETHLRVCPECTREWQALVAIDTLFRQTPALQPAADFTERTLARLPNRKHRIWLMSAVYGLLLLSGLLPVLVIIWAVMTYGSVINQPALVGSLINAIEQTIQVLGTLFGALLNGFGEFAVQQPAVVGWLLVMSGVVVIWSGVYRQLLNSSGLHSSAVPSTNT